MDEQQYLVPGAEWVDDTYDQEETLPPDSRIGWFDSDATAPVTTGRRRPVYVSGS